MSDIEIKLDEMVGTNKTKVNVDVAERSTGQFTVGAGFSSLDGALGSIGIKESNLFGEAKELSLNLGLSTKLPPSLFPSGTCLANAKNICLLVKFKSLAFFELAITIPSYPTFISTTSIPFSLH